MYFTNLLRSFVNQISDKTSSLDKSSAKYVSIEQKKITKTHPRFNTSEFLFCSMEISGNIYGNEDTEIE